MLRGILQSGRHLFGPAILLLAGSMLLAACGEGGDGDVAAIESAETDAVEEEALDEEAETTETTSSTVTIRDSSDTTGSTSSGSTGSTSTERPDPPVVGDDQELSWGSVEAWRFGEVRTVSVSASSGLDVALSASGACSVESSVLQTVLATGAGDCEVTASQAGSDDWNAVTESRVFEVDKAQAALQSFSDSFEYDGNQETRCLLNGEVGCASYVLQATSEVPVSFALADGASSNCRFDGGRFWAVNNASLPQTCDILVRGEDTATHVGFEEVRPAVVNPFKVQLTLSVVDVSPDFQITVSTNFIVGVGGCGQRGTLDVGSTTLTVTQAQVTDDGCTFMALVGGDASKTTECRRVDLPAAEVSPCP